MNFALRELDVTKYLADIQTILEADDCHVFVDTSVLSQLFKLNSGARRDFFAWVESCKNRFHVPNWVVMEYNKRVYGNKLKDYVDELGKAKEVGAHLKNLQRFFWGYVDDEELRGTTYQDKRQELLDNFGEIKENYAKILKAVNTNIAEHIVEVQKEIDMNLKSLVMDTDIYNVIGNMYFDWELRFENNVPPGYKDDTKTTNKLGDLIIWKEILQYCKTKHINKAVFISRDEKPDTVYCPAIQTFGGRAANDDEQQKVAHECLLYEFKLNNGGSEHFRLINFYTLVKILSDKYNDLAFSFQLVSHNPAPVTEDHSTEEDEPIIDVNPTVTEDTTLPQPSTETVHDQQPVALEYSLEAQHDSDYLLHCSNEDLQRCIERLKSYNWYTQNDAVLDLRKMLTKVWDNVQDDKNDFFVVGRNIVQSAEGNSFEACRFINDMPEILSRQPEYVRRAIVNGCLYEVFFDSNATIRHDGFKSRYLQDVIKSVKNLHLDNPFGFINERLSLVEGVFVPGIDDQQNHVFSFTFEEPANELDFYHTTSLRIDGKDVSTSFTMPIERVFADVDDIKSRLSQRYAVPEDHISIEGLNDAIHTVHYIKQDDTLADDIFNL